MVLWVYGPKFLWFYEIIISIVGPPAFVSEEHINTADFKQ